jgi:uncharacterized membrane protein
MSAYLLLKLAHILSAAVLLGTGLGIAFFLWQADRGGDIRTMAAVSRLVVRADFCMTLPAVIAQPVTGLMLAWTIGLPLGATWIAASFVLYGVVLACWIPVVFLQLRIARRAAELSRTGQPPNGELRRLLRRWYTLGWPALVAMLAIFVLMVLKPR